MKRLTIHLTNAPFITKEQKKIVKDNDKIVYKPKKSKCIINTMSYEVKDYNTAKALLASLDGSFGHSTKISKWYISNIK